MTIAQDKSREKLFGAIFEQIIKNSLDIIILKATNERPMNGYEINLLVRRKFGIVLSPGTIYPMLRVLEKKDILRSFVIKGVHYYSPSIKGESIIAIISVNRSQIGNLVGNIY